MIYEKLLKKSEMNDLLLGLKGRSVIEILDIQSELPALLRATHENRHKSNRKIKDIREGLFGAMFYNPSSRARTAVNAAIAKLDGDMFEINVANSQLARGESIQDTCDFYNHMLNGLAIRVSDHAVIQEFDKYSTNPIINLLSDLEHPTQTLADLQTLFDNYGYLRGLKITYCGEFNNTSRSLLLGCLSQGVNVTISCPNEVDSVTYIKALALADENGCSFQVEKDPKKAVEGSDGIYTDVTESIGQGIDDKDACPGAGPPWR